MAAPTETSPLLSSRRTFSTEPSAAEPNNEIRRRESRVVVVLGLPFSTILIGLCASAVMLVLEWRFDVLNSATVNFQLFRGDPTDPNNFKSYINPRSSIDHQPILGAPLMMMSTEEIEETSFSDLSFADLGVYLIQQYYADSLDVIDNVFVESVQPVEVALPRKVLLKTRDLLDVFSPLYPANIHNDNNHSHHHHDLWTQLRWEVAKGYQIVGEFLDLNHCHINYTKSEGDALRNEILDWKAKFTMFQQAHPEIPAYLASPLEEGRVHHAKESRFYWLNTPQEQLPQGSSDVTTMMQRLAIHQAELALWYLGRTLTFQSIMSSHSAEEQLERQETFHNLRKTLRSMCDEYDIMGAGVFLTDPSTPSLDAEWANLVKARGVLGDLNDLWTAYDFYVQHDKLHHEQERLSLAVDSAFVGFKQWAHDEYLEGDLHYMIQVMGGSDSSSDSSGNEYHFRPKSLSKFLKISRKYPTQSIVIGNEAGDADSVISAIALAWIETYAPLPITLTRKTPIVSIPKEDLVHLRPEINMLLELAGVEKPAHELLFVDSSVFHEDMQTAQVTLCDHNEIEDRFQNRDWDVIEILDHHEDKGLYSTASPRRIAFADGNALVASACTLVVERFIELWSPPYPAAIALLLMGVILLDSVNLSVEAGKVTQRDRDAIQNLLDHVDWKQLPKATQWSIGMSVDDSVEDRPDTTTFFQLLQDAKYSPAFWESVSASDALRYDYKEFDYNDGIFGISTVLMRLEDFVHKKELVPSLVQYMERVNISFLGVMFAYMESGQLRRELMICSKSTSPIQMALVDDKLLSSSLALQALPRGDSIFAFSAKGLDARFFRQKNIAASRKQIGPLLQGYLNKL